MRRKIPEKTVQRLLLYYRALYFLVQQGVKDISSKSLADLLEIKGSQVRKDLSYFGSFGRRGAGYDVLALRDKIAQILGIQKEKKVCIIGMGSLGSALAAYKGFEALGFKIVAVFDNSEQKIGRKLRGYHCYDIKELSRVIKGNNIKIAMLTVPQEAAQETAVKLDECGIKAVMNFTPIKLSLSKKVKVSNIDLAQELKTLSFFVA
jgi:redox-sensing transcriptional repressor